MKIKILPLNEIIEPNIIYISGDEDNSDIAFWCKGHYYGIDDIKVLEGKQKIKKVNKIIKKLYKTKMKFNFYINIGIDSI